MKYGVYIRDIEAQRVEVEAGSAEEAREKVSQAIADGSLWEEYDMKEASESVWEVADDMTTDPIEE